MRNIYLGRTSTGDILSMVPDGLDYSKGLAWIAGDPNLVAATTVPAFMTYGRHGALNFYNIVSEKIMPAGSLALPTSLRDLYRVEPRAHDLAAA
jgi:hypothetical protein